LPEPTLALTKTELEAEIGFFLGFGRGSQYGEAPWSVQQTNLINAARRAGLRSFYLASAGQADGSSGYQWSFLRPQASLSMQSGDQTVQLPDDYHGVEGRVTISSPNSQIYRPVPVVGINRIQEQYSRTPNMTGWPQLLAIQPIRPPAGTIGQRFQFVVFPVADQAYTLAFTYYINPNDIDANRPYPYGGAAHSETITAACLAAAEAKGDDMTGVQAERYRQLLAGSIEVDRRNKPQLQGYCGDQSDMAGMDYDRRRNIYENDTILFDGTQY
jgi:hypothetical protein